MTGPVILADLVKNSREHLRVALDEYQGHKLVDLRVTTELTQGTGVRVPTKKGVSVNVSHLPALVVAFTAAEAKARELGWIGGAA
jgi:hypothetical protein